MFVLGNDDEPQHVSYIKAQPQKVTKQPHEVRYDNYNGFRYGTPNSGESQIYRSVPMSPEGILFQLGPQIGESNVNRLLPTRLQNPHIHRNGFAYHQSTVPNNSLKLFVLSAPHKQSERHPYLAYEQLQCNTGHAPIENQQTHQHVDSYISPPYHGTNESKLYFKQWPEITKHPYPVPNQEMNKYPEFLLSHPRQSIEASSYLSRENQQLTEPKHQKTENLLRKITRTKNQQVPLQQATEYPDDKQTPGQSPIVSQQIGTDVFLADFAAETNENRSGKQSKDLAANIQYSLNSQQSTYPYGQHKSEADRIPAQAPLINQLIDNEMFSAKLTAGPNKSETETQPNEIVSNIQNPFNGQQSIYENNKHDSQPQQIHNQTPFIHQPIYIDSLPTKLPAEQRTTENEQQTTYLATSIQNSLNSQLSIYPYNQEVVETKQIHSLAPFKNEQTGVGAFSTELPTEQNTTENETQAHYLATNIQNSLNSQQSIAPSKGEKVQTEHIHIHTQTPFTHQPIGVDVFPTELPTEQNSTENETQVHYLVTNIQNSLENKQSINHYSQYNAQPEHIFNQARFIHQPIGSQVHPETLSNGPNITGNETQTNEFLNNIQISLNSQRSLHPYSQQKAQPEHIPSKIPFIHQPIGIGVSPTELLISQNITDNETQTSDLATNIQQSLNSQPSIYPYKQEIAQPEHIHSLPPITHESNCSRVFPANLSTRPNGAENKTRATGSVNNVQNSPSNQTGNVTDNAIVSKIKLSHDSEAEIEKLMKDVTRTSDMTNIKQSFTSLQTSNTTDKVNDRKTNRPGVKNSSHQKQVTPKPTPRKPSNQNSKRQKSATHKPASRKSITRKIVIRIPVTQKWALPKSGARKPSTQKSLSQTPSTPSSTPTSSTPTISTLTTSTPIHFTQKPITQTLSTPSPSTGISSTVVPFIPTLPKQTPSIATSSTPTPSIATSFTATSSTAAPSAATPSTATFSTATSSTAIPSTATPFTAKPSTVTSSTKTQSTQAS